MGDAHDIHIDPVDNLWNRAGLLNNKLEMLLGEDTPNLEQITECLAEFEEVCKQLKNKKNSSN